MVKPVAVFGSETLAVSEIDMNRGDGDIKMGTWTGGRARNVENKN